MGSEYKSKKSQLERINLNYSVSSAYKDKPSLPEIKTAVAQKD
jgi:hypothetical protein